MQAIYAVTDGETAVCGVRAQMTPALFPGRTYFLATDGINGEPQCIKEAAGNAADMYYTFSDVDPTGSTVEAVKQTVDAYRKTYPKASDISIYTFATYDCARILIEAIKTAIKKNGGHFPTRPEVLDAIANSHFTGVTGTYYFDANGDALSPLMSIYAVSNGHWVYKQQVDAAAN